MITIENNKGHANIVTHGLQTRNYVFVGGNLDGIYISTSSPQKSAHLSYN